MEVRLYSYFRWCGYFWGPWASFVTTDEFSVMVKKKKELIQVLVSHEITAYFSIFNQFKLNGSWPYYQEHVNQIILKRTTL